MSPIRRTYIVALVVIIVVAALIGVYYATRPPPTPPVEKLKVAMLYATPLEEPFCAVHHEAFLRAEEKLDVEYDYTDNVGYGPEMEDLTREYAETGYNITFTDVTVFEERSRILAKEYYEKQGTIFMGSYSALGPSPGMGVYDWANWDVMYLLGMLAGGMTETNVIGAVCSYPIPPVNKAIWGYIMGAKEVNPDVKVKITYIESWYDPPKAKEAALAQIDAGADVIYEGRYGTIDAAVEGGVYAIGGGGIDHHDLAPDTVLSSWIVDMYPLIKHIIELYRAGLWEPADYTEWTSLAKGGTYLAPYYNFEDIIPQDLQDAIEQKKQDITDGLFKVEIHPETPPSD